MKTAAVILAAGGSSRLGRPKQLVRIGDEALLDRTIRIAHEAGTAPVYVILGANAEIILAGSLMMSRAISSEVSKADTAAGPALHTRVRIVENGQWREGIASSIRAGVEAAARADALLFLACDQPAVTAEHLRQLLEAAASSRSSLAASAYAGCIGIPAVFTRHHFAELLSLHGDSGARSVLEKHSRDVAVIPLQNGELDLDTPGSVAAFELSSGIHVKPA